MCTPVATVQVGNVPRQKANEESIEFSKNNRNPIGKLFPNLGLASDVCTVRIAQLSTSSSIFCRDTNAFSPCVPPKRLPFVQEAVIFSQFHPIRWHFHMRWRRAAVTQRNPPRDFPLRVMEETIADPKSPLKGFFIFDDYIALVHCWWGWWVGSGWFAQQQQQQMGNILYVSYELGLFQPAGTTPSSSATTVALMKASQAFATRVWTDSSVLCGFRSSG